MQDRGTVDRAIRVCFLSSRATGNYSLEISKIETSLTVDGQLGLGLVPSDRVLGSTHVDSVVGRTCPLDLQTPIIQDLRPVQFNKQTTNGGCGW